MNGDKKKDIDWQSELKSRLEAYEKRTGRRIVGRKDPEAEKEELLGSSAGPEQESADAVEEGQDGSLAEDTGPIDSEKSFPDEEEDIEEDYPAGPDFLAVLDGIDEEDDTDSFLFRERLSRDRDPEDDPDVLMSDKTAGGFEDEESSYFDGIREDELDEDEELYPEPVVKVVNIEEFRMDSSAEEVFVPLREESPLGHENEYEPPEEEEVSKEIIVSRLLSATVDMVIAVIIAAGFMEIAAWKLSLNFFELGVLKWIGLLAVIFYTLNCLYFLTLTQRTPGMLLTDLKLVPGKGRKNLTFLPVLIRTLAFFPSALCVTGLVWSFFDYQARCLHDIVSGTRIISSRS
jgi:uncharacterized RDD family membrane protein YckC